MLTGLQYRLARLIARVAPTTMNGSAYSGRSKLQTLFGEELLREAASKDVIDFGCGSGEEAVELAQHGARVVGIDIREDQLELGRARAADAGLGDRCRFAMSTTEPADIVVSVDSFEHFEDPAAVLRSMFDLLRPGGRVMVSFGPPWYHPLGGHLFSIFPWAHVIMSEKALIRWRADIRSDGATRFEEVEGGLNRMTIARFERLVAASPFVLERVSLVPIRPLRRLHHRFTREWTTAVVRATLRKAGGAPSATDGAHHAHTG